jgi:hypothetical protein
MRVENSTSIASRGAAALLDEIESAIKELEAAIAAKERWETSEFVRADTQLEAGTFEAAVFARTGGEVVKVGKVVGAEAERGALEKLIVRRAELLGEDVDMSLVRATRPIPLLKPFGSDNRIVYITCGGGGSKGAILSSLPPVISLSPLPSHRLCSAQMRASGWRWCVCVCARMSTLVRRPTLASAASLAPRRRRWEATRLCASPTSHRASGSRARS